MKNLSKIPAPKKGSFLGSNLSRVWFLNQGCKQVPLDQTDGKVLWTDGKKRWLNASGQLLKHDFSPSMQDKHYAHGHGEPKLRNYGNKRCRILTAVTFYGPRPTFKDSKNGKTYVGICHHLIPDLLDYSAANLLCWLTRAEHAEADRRQRALKQVVPEGDLHCLSYERLRYLQDPRTTSREVFEKELEQIQAKREIN